MNADDLAKILDELGQRLGPTGQHVFELAVRQVYINAALNLIWSGGALLLMGIILIVAARYSLRRWHEQVRLYAEGEGRWSRIQDHPDLDDFVFPWIIGGGLALFAGVFLAAVAFAALSSLLNPEYAALRDLIGQVR